MKIQSGDRIDAFSHGKSISGRVIGIANDRIALNTGSENVGVSKEEVLKVNGKVFSDRPVEVYTKEPPEATLAKELSQGFQDLIDKYYPD